MVQAVLQAVVTPQAKQLPNSGSVQLALFNPDGTPWTPEAPAPEVDEATLTTPGVVKQAAAVDDSEAAEVEDLVTDFNVLLEALRDAGIIAPSA